MQLPRLLPISPGILDGQFDFSLMGAASVQYQLYQVKLDFPRLANEHAFLSLTGRRRSMPREDYFGPGPDPRFPSTEQLFPETVAPGVDHQLDFLKYNFSAAVDTRDSPGNPHRGGYYAASHTTYNDRTLDRYNFSRTEVELQQYVPFTAGNR